MSHRRSVAAVVPLQYEVISWSRYSSPHQRTASIEQQEAECDARCRSLGLPLPTRRFRLRAQSAKDMRKMSPLQELLRLAAIPPPSGVQRVLVYWKHNRLSRNVFDSVLLADKLHREYGIRLVTCNGRDSNDPKFAEELAEDAAAAQRFLRELGEDVKRGLAGRVAEGYWVSQAPLGYRLEREVPDPADLCRRKNAHLYRLDDDAPQVRQVRREFELVASGLSVVQAARQMNAEGSCTNRDGIRERLAMPIYKGDVYYCGKFVRHDEALRLVSDETWERAQATVRRRAEQYGCYRRSDSNLVRGGVAARRAPLSGILSCGICGHALIRLGGSKQRDGTVKKYYACPNGRCGKCVAEHHVQAQPLERAVIDAALDSIMDGAAIEYVVAGVQRQVSAADAEVAGERRRLERDLRAAETRLRRCVQQIEQHGPSEAVQARIRELEVEIRDLRAKASAVPAAGRVSVLREAVLAYLGRVGDMLRSGDPVRLRAGLEQVVTDGLITPTGRREWRVTFKVSPLGVLRDLLVANTISGATGVRACCSLRASIPTRRT